MKGQKMTITKTFRIDHVREFFTRARTSEEALEAFKTYYSNYSNYIRSLPRLGDSYYPVLDAIQNFTHEVFPRLCAVEVDAIPADAVKVPAGFWQGRLVEAA